MKNILNNLFAFLRSGRFGRKAKVFIKKSIFLRPFYNIAVQRLIDYDYPLTLYLEPTNACNQKCIICPRAQSKREVGFIDFSLFRKIIDESKPHGIRHFILHKDGEPLLHPEIVDMVSYIKKINPKNTVYISTNGLLLEREKAEALMAAGLNQLNISIDAANKETYQKIRGGDFDKVEYNIKEAISIKKDKKFYKTTINLQIIRMQEAIDEIDLFIKKWRVYGIEFSVQPYLNWGGVKYDPILKTGKIIKRYPCYALWLAPAINWDGAVSICCLDWNAQEILGNVRDLSLSQIWQGEKIRLYRKYHLTKQYSKIPLCASCNCWGKRTNFWFPWQYKK